MFRDDTDSIIVKRSIFNAYSDTTANNTTALIDCMQEYVCDTISEAELSIDKFGLEIR
jgi:hypothetical protein